MVGPIITLVTGFGVTGNYVCDATIPINPQTVLVDLAHHVKHRAVHEAEFPHFVSH